MKHSLLIYIISFAISLHCASKHGIESDIIPAETFDAKITDEKCALIISRNFDISCEEIKPDKLENILKNSMFINKERKYNTRQISKFVIFKIIIENTGDSPLETGELKLQYVDTISRPLSADDLKNMNSLSAINFSEFLSLYKLDVKDICENDIDFQRDIIKNTVNRIYSGDKALFFAVFNWIPVQIRKFNFSIAIKSDISQKIIDFKFRRFEYRKSGKDFIKPEKDNND